MSRGIIGKEKGKSTKGFDIVRLKKAGHRFEVMCNAGTVTSYRDGSIKDIGDVVTVKRVYSNAAKGTFAEKKELDALHAAMAASSDHHDDDDDGGKKGKKGKGKKAGPEQLSEEELCGYILEHGDLLTTEDERLKARAADHSIIGSIAAAAAPYVFDPSETLSALSGAGGPRKGKKGGALVRYTAADIERELKNCRFNPPPSLHPASATAPPSKELVLLAVAQLRKSGVVPIQRLTARIHTASDADTISKVIAAHPLDVMHGVGPGQLLVCPLALRTVTKDLEAVDVADPHHVVLKEGEPDLALLALKSSTATSASKGDGTAKSKKEKGSDAKAPSKAAAETDVTVRGHGRPSWGSDDEKEDGAAGTSRDAVVAGVLASLGVSDSDSDDGKRKKKGGKKGGKKAAPAPAPKSQKATAASVKQKKPWEHSDSEDD